MSFEGTLNLITGPMYSGKTTTLLRRLFIEAEIGNRVLYINHASDTRSSGPFSTHNPLYKQELAQQSKVKFVSTECLNDVGQQAEIHDVIGIDESQFFGKELVSFVHTLVEDQHKHVIVTGLDGNFKREKFGFILDLIPMADTYEKLVSYCKICASKQPRIQKKAPFTKRIVNDDDEVLVGGKESYVPVCRACYSGKNEQHSPTAAEQDTKS